MTVTSLLQLEVEADRVKRMESLPSKTVLCVDDEKIGLRVRKIMLESRGYRVLTASDGAEGLRLFEGLPLIRLETISGTASPSGHLLVVLRVVR